MKKYLFVLVFPGPPVNAVINQTSASYSNDSSHSTVTLLFTITDTSDAPARGVLIDVPGVESTYITFPKPIQGSSNLSYTLRTLLNGIAPSVYNITFTPVNRLGNGSTFYLSTFLPGQLITYPCLFEPPLIRILVYPIRTHKFSCEYHYMFVNLIM